MLKEKFKIEENWVLIRSTMLSLALFLVLVQSAHSDLPNAVKEEIAHLFEFVSATPCRYERNGDMHTGPEAAAHMQKKYNYFEEDVATTEDFIRLAATKSTFSGKPYRVHCDGDSPIDSSDWLHQELQRLRVQR